jgi:hypothetical protein
MRWMQRGSVDVGTGLPLEPFAHTRNFSIFWPSGVNSDMSLTLGINRAQRVIADHKTAFFLLFCVEWRSEKESN